MSAPTHDPPPPATTHALRAQPMAWQHIVDDAVAELCATPTLARARRVAARVLPWANVAVRLAHDANEDSRNGGSEHRNVDGASSSDDYVDVVLSRHATSAVCGHRFAESEFVARCLQCAADHTCVMCMSCFANSPCRAHEHRISMGGAGGMCDCGDGNAWAPASFCSRHRGRGNVQRSARVTGLARRKAQRGSGAATSTSPSAGAEGGDDDAANEDDDEVTDDDDDGDDGDGASDEALLASLSSEERVWVTTVLRGAVQLLAAWLYLSTTTTSRTAATEAGHDEDDNDDDDDEGDDAQATTATTTVTTAQANTTARRRLAAQRRVLRVRRTHGQQNATTTTTATATTTAAAAAAKSTLLFTSGPTTMLLRLLALALQRVSMTGDCGRRLLTRLLCEPAQAIRLHNNNNNDDEEAARTCLDVFFCFAIRNENNNGDDGASGGSGVAATREHASVVPVVWQPLLECLGNCITDAAFRAAFAGLVATYAETIHDAAELDALTLQIVGSADSVHAAMRPTTLAYRGAHDTTLHRHAAGVLYELALRRDEDSSFVTAQATDAFSSSSGSGSDEETDKDEEEQQQLPQYMQTAAARAAARAAAAATTWLFRMSAEKAVNEAAYLNWYYLSLCSRRVRRAMALSTNHLRALLTVLQVVTVSAAVRHGADDALETAIIMQILDAACLNSIMWHLQSGVRDVVAALLRLRVCASSSQHDDSNDSDVEAVVRAVHATIDRLVTPPLHTTLRQSLVLDAPRDAVAAANDYYARLRRRCRVHDEAHALLLRRTACEEAAAAAASVHVARDGDGNAEGKEQRQQQQQERDAHARRPRAAVATALTFAYVQTLLREVYAALRTLLAVQCNSFCNGDVPLLQHSTPHQRRQRQRYSKTHDTIAQYDLLHAKHATALSTHVPRLIAVLVRAWLLETHARRGASTAAASPQTHTLRALLTSVLCDDDTQRQQQPSSSPTQQQQQQQRQQVRMSPSPRQLLPHLLDSLVMPFVLLSQVEQRLWRRHGDDVQRYVQAYLHVTNTYCLEHDVFMLQLMTLCMPASRMAMHILRRFSYAAARTLSVQLSLSTTSTRDIVAGLLLETRGSGNTTAAPVVLPARTRGYARFARLLLTLVLDTTKASPTLADYADASVERHVALALAQQRLPHLSLLQRVSGNLSHSWGSFVADAAPHKNVKDAVAAVLQRIALGETGPRGSVLFRLRDTATWRRCVAHVYAPSSSDEALEALYAMYHGLVTRERVAAARTAAAAAAAASGAGSSSSSATTTTAAVVRVPPPNLAACTSAQSPLWRQHEELRPRLRALLHTRALLHVALYALVRYVVEQQLLLPQHEQQQQQTQKQKQQHSNDVEEEAKATKRGKRESVARDGSDSGDDADDSDEYESISTTTDDDEEDEEDEEYHDEDDDKKDEDDDDDNSISEALLQHAVTALYLAVSDDSERRGVVVLDENDKDEDDNDDDEQRNNGSGDEDWRGVLPLAELRAYASLRAMMQHKLRPATLRYAAAGARQARHGTTRSTTSATSSHGVTVCDVLHALRAHWLRNETEDKFSLTLMLERTLHRLGVARFACSDEDDGDGGDDGEGASASKAAAAAAAAAQGSHAQRLRERQARLLQRMQQRDARALSRVVAQASATAAAATAAASGASSTANDGEQQQQQAHGGSTATDATLASARGGGDDKADASSAHSVLGRLLLSLATTECCVCRLDRDEPLVLLAHCSASAVLRHLGSVAHTLQQQRTTHAHFAVCGHAAHISCVEKLCTQLARQWQQRWFQGKRYLGPGECSCPVCMMICTTLTPVPTLTTTTTASSSSSSSGGSGSTLSPSQQQQQYGTDERSLFADVRQSTLTGADASTATTLEQKKYVSVISSAHIDLARMYVQCVFHTYTSDGSSSSSSSSESTTPQQQQGTNTASHEESSSSSSTSSSGTAKSYTVVHRRDHIDGAWTLRSVYHVVRSLVEAVAAGHTLARRDLLAVTSLLLTSSPRRLALCAPTLRETYTTHGEAFALLVLELLLRPGAAAMLVRAYTCMLLANCSAAQLLRLAAHTDGDDDEEATWRVCLWAELSCLTLLRVLLTTDGSASLVLTWPPNSSSNTTSVADSGELPQFATVCPEALQSAAAQRAAVLRMLQYLCELPQHGTTTPSAVVAAAIAAAAHARQLTDSHNSGSRSDDAAFDYDAVMLLRACDKAAVLPRYRGGDSNPLPAAAAAAAAQSSSSLVYRNPTQWVSCLLERVLHLPVTFTAIAQAHAAALACVECGAAAQQLQHVLAVLCCTCGGFLCEDCSKEGVLERHAWRCGRGVGLYMDVHRASLIVVNGQSEKLSFVPSIYATEYGETPSSVHSDAWLVRDATRGARLLQLWLLNAWGIDSATIKNTYYGPLIS